MSADHNRAGGNVKRVLILVANPTVAHTTGWPVGFWGSELTHPWWEFAEAGMEVELASPDGGPALLDAMSDPAHESGYASGDWITAGFLSRPENRERLATTAPLAAVDPGRFDALLVAGGQSPMFTFPGRADLAAHLGAFFEAGKVVGAVCHGVAALLDLKAADGAPLVAGRTLTGFSDREEDLVDAMVGQKVMPFRIESRARELGANFVADLPWRPFAVRDGALVTGQQQFSGALAARLMVAALGR